jgi:hypothetical protein
MNQSRLGKLTISHRKRVAPVGSDVRPHVKMRPYNGRAPRYSSTMHEKAAMNTP